MKKLRLYALWLCLAAGSTFYAQEINVVDGASIFGDLTARQIGPALMSGRVNDLEIHPTNNKIIYLGAGGGASGNQMMVAQPLFQYLTIIFSP